MLLPIVNRELRVAARNKATYRLRLLFAVGAVTIGGGLGLLSMFSGGLPGSQLGIWIFNVLKWIALIFACAAGIFLTSDSLSEEKREGTLGLLFLTDLRGHDVVLGKLLATSLRTFYSLLAIFPVMAFSFVLGGVAAEDFRHTLLALCNALFFSLALGMAISVISRDSNKAMTGAMATMVVFLCLIPGLDALLPGGKAGFPFFGLLSPAYAFTHTISYRPSEFWLSLILVQLAGWCCLAVASWLTPKTWQDKAVRYIPRTGWRFRLLGRAAAGSSRQKLLDQNPVCWLVARDRWAANLARLAILLILGVFALSLASLFLSQGPGTPVAGMMATATNSTTTTIMTSTNGATSGAIVVRLGVGSASRMAGNVLFMLARTCASVLSLALEFWLAAHVCRFYVDGRKSGFLELLLVTPVTQADIFKGHWLALRRLFLPPAAAQLLLTLVFGAIQLWADSSVVVAAPPAGTTMPPAFGQNIQIAEVIALALGTISWCVGLFTIVWFSIWMGLTSKKIPIAMLKTFWYTKILPWFGISLASVILMIPASIALGFNSVWLYPMILYLFFILVNLALIGRARRRAREAFAQWANSAVV